MWLIFMKSQMNIVVLVWQLYSNTFIFKKIYLQINIYLLGIHFELIQNGSGAAAGGIDGTSVAMSS